MTRQGITAEMVGILAAPTPREDIEKRQGNRRHDGECSKQYGQCQLEHALLDYVDARFVMNRLDEIGAENWQDRYEDRPDGSVRCGIGVLIDGEWVWKWDVGDPSDIEATKGAFSDAFKRAGVKWGIARDLYGHTTQGRAAVAPPARPASPPRPAASSPAPAGGTLQEPDYLRDAPPPFAEATVQAHDEAASRDGFCPNHGIAWVLRPGGVSKATGKAYDAFWACPSDERPYCKAKPSAKWVAMHEVAS